MRDGLDSPLMRARRPSARPGEPPALRRWAAANALVAFLLEVSMLAALAYAGFRAPPPLTVVAGVGLPLLAIVLWGLFFAPRAGRRIPWPWLPLASLGMFAAAALALAGAGEALLAQMMGVIAFANMIVSFWLRRKD